MLVQPSRNPLAIPRVVIKVVLEPLDIPLLVGLSILEFLDAEILSFLHPSRNDDAASMSRIAAVAAIFFGGEVQISFA